MRIYKTKVFARWADKEGLPDDDLISAITELEAGSVEASLGNYLYKKRIARQGQGKRGSYRTVIAFRHAERAFFLFGFEKGAKDNISSKEKKALATMAKQFMGYTQHALEKAMKSGALIEVKVKNEQDN